jgi:hypothetical protein
LNPGRLSNVRITRDQGEVEGDGSRRDQAVAAPPIDSKP